MIRLFYILLFLSGCVRQEDEMTIDHRKSIVCYSAGFRFYGPKNISDAIQTHRGWEFKDIASGEVVKVTGDCIIKN